MPISDYVCSSGQDLPCGACAACLAAQEFAHRVIGAAADVPLLPVIDIPVRRRDPLTIRFDGPLPPNVTERVQAGATAYLNGRAVGTFMVNDVDVNLVSLNRLTGLGVSVGRVAPAVLDLSDVKPSFLRLLQQRIEHYPKSRLSRLLDDDGDV